MHRGVQNKCDLRCLASEVLVIDVAGATRSNFSMAAVKVLRVPIPGELTKKARPPPPPPNCPSVSDEA